MSTKGSVQYELDCIARLGREITIESIMSRSVKDAEGEIEACVKELTVIRHRLAIAFGLNPLTAGLPPQVEATS